MRTLLAVTTVLFCFGGVLAQPGITDVRQKDSCYLRYDKDHNVIKNNRYAEWQCGKLAGVIDCNERLEYDQEADIVYMNNRDMVNAAAAGKPFNGICETCHMNGQLERRVTFVNGKENGVDTTYYKTGCPQVVRNHINGLENGQWLYYYDSTEYLAWEMNYMVGQKHGKHIFFKKNGDTTRWENYNNGLLDGVKRTYYPNSKIKREVTYKMGVMEGPFKIYNLDGVVIEELNYRQGKKDEECKYYYEDGKPLKIENWTMGVKSGEFKIFYYQGTIQVSENYNKKGQKEGWFMEYYHDGVTKRKALYKKDELIEEHRYDEQGKETYSFGAPTGDDKEDDEMPSTDKKKKKKKKE